MNSISIYFGSQNSIKRVGSGVCSQNSINLETNYGLLSVLHVPNNVFNTVEILFSTHLGKVNIMYHPFSTHLATIHCSYHLTRLRIGLAQALICLLCYSQNKFDCSLALALLGNGYKPAGFCHPKPMPTKIKSAR